MLILKTVRRNVRVYIIKDNSDISQHCDIDHKSVNVCVCCVCKGA